jgi:UV DNA damage endonuclease
MPLCERAGVPLVYDVHHHRCLPDGYTVGEATELAFSTWGDREPYTHLSSPKEGWAGPNVRAHADYIDPADFPEEWLPGLSRAEGSRTMTIDVEAKAKERAVLQIKEAVAHYISSTGRTSHSPSNSGQCTRCSSMKSRATFIASSLEATSTMA